MTYSRWVNDRANTIKKYILLYPGSGRAGTRVIDSEYDKNENGEEMTEWLVGWDYMGLGLLQ